MEYQLTHSNKRMDYIDFEQEPIPGYPFETKLLRLIIFHANSRDNTTFLKQTFILALLAFF